MQVPKLPQVQNAPAVQSFQSGRGSSDPAAFGFSRAGEAFGRALQNTGAVVGDIATKLKADDDERLAKEADVAFSQAVRQNLYGDDATPGYLQSQGQTALDQAKATDEALEKARRDIAKDLNPAAARMFNDVAARRVERARDSIVGHTSRQRTIADAAASTARIAEFSDDAAAAWNDPAAVTAAIAGARLEASDLAAKAGLDAETAASEIEAAETTIHAKVIDQMLANQVPGAADAYFKQHRDRIDGKAHADILRHINAAKTKVSIELRDDVSDAVSVLAMGKTPPGLAALREAVTGTRYAKTLDQAIDNRAAVDTFVHLPLPQQRAEVRKLDQQQVMSAGEAVQYQLKQKALAQTDKLIEDGHGIAVASRLGHIQEPVALDYGAPETLRQRRQQADVAGSRLGVHVSPLTPDEIEDVTDRILTEPPGQANSTLAALAAGFGEDGAAEIASKVIAKQPAAAMAILTVGTRPAVAREMLNGQRLLRDNKDVLPSKDERQSAINDTYGNLFEGTDATALAPMIEAANAIYAARTIPTGDLRYSDDRYEQALKDAVGGIVEFDNGDTTRSIIAPVPGMDQGQFDDLMKSLKQEDLARFGNGAPVHANGLPFDVGLFGANNFIFDGSAHLVTSGFDGRYMVMSNGGFILTDDGQPYELDLRGFAGRNR